MKRDNKLTALLSRSIFPIMSKIINETECTMKLGLNKQDNETPLCHFIVTVDEYEKLDRETMDAMARWIKATEKETKKLFCNRNGRIIIELDKCLD